MESFYFDNILMDEKSYRNILALKYFIKTSTDTKTLKIRFNKVDGFVKVYDGTRCLVLFGREKYDAI